MPKQNEIHEILKIRKSIDLLDDKLCRILKERKKLVKKIQKKKLGIKIPRYDPKREKEIIQSLVKKHPQLRASFIKKIFAIILKP